MLISGIPLAGGPLAALGQAGADSLPDPVAMPLAVIWSMRVMLGGQDVSDHLTGSIRIEREEAAAAIAEFSVWLSEEPADPFSWKGREVAIYYRELKGTEWVESLRFTGWLEQPSYDPRNRIVSCEATDRLQDLVEALTIEQVDLLAGGEWNSDIYDPVDGRSHWDYAQERLSSRPVSLDRGVDGALRVTAWEASTPFMVFGPGSTVDQSLSVTPAKLTDSINKIEITLSYRFSRLRERHQEWKWRHPDILGTSVDASFCVWRHDSTELPDISTVTDALNGAGYQLLDGADWIRLPPTGVYCSPPVGWRNDYTDLLLGGTFTGGMRWVQPVTETYTVTVLAQSSIDQAGEVLRRDGTSIESENDRTQDWESAAFTAPAGDAVQDAAGDYVVDLRDDIRLGAAMGCLYAVASTKILAAHRDNKVSWQAPTSVSLGLDLVHTARNEDRCLAQGKVFSLIDEWDIDQQTALTTVTVAVTRGGGGVQDAYVMPEPPDTAISGDVPVLIELPNQFHGHLPSIPYDENKLGFSGNYDNNNDPTTDNFPRQFKLEAPEVPAAHRDEITGDVVVTLRIAIPDDPLEL